MNAHPQGLQHHSEAPGAQGRAEWAPGLLQVHYSGGRCGCMERQSKGYREISVTFSPFCCESKTAAKKKHLQNKSFKITIVVLTPFNDMGLSKYICFFFFFKIIPSVDGDWKD